MSDHLQYLFVDVVTVEQAEARFTACQRTDLANLYRWAARLRGETL